ncbi:MAG: ABC-F family ATP-binding cassette domain-containing protein [Acidobacteria bacterium]|nr:ABC-F family ATP-binding cassette domain-containing protein [Acidobacteriota bacterium]
MSLIRLRQVSKRYGRNQVLRDVFYRLAPGDRTGLLGRNGSGKTTVLRLILGREEPSGGEIEAAADLRIGYFSQFSELSGEVSIESVLREGFEPIRRIEASLADVARELAEGAGGDRQNGLLKRYEALTDEMEHRDGWSCEHRIDTALSRLGFSRRHRTMPIRHLSGGWRNRAALAKILLEAPDVLLLDEPTNFLDFDGLAWLESWLAQFRGAALVVSHDRHFLDRAVNRVVEIQNHRFHEYDCGFVEFVRRKRGQIRQLEREFRHEEELLAFEAEAIQDRREAARNPSRSLTRRLADIRKRQAPREVDTIVTGIYRGMRTADELCEVTQLSKRYGGQTLFDGLDFTLHRGDRLVVVGPNGCGKTTLLRVLRNEVAPDAGRVHWKLGDPWVDYNVVLDGLDPKATVTRKVNFEGLAHRAPRKQVHRFLELLQFSAMDLQQEIGTLSGGQRARVALALSLLSGAPVVILDEPTNHLDVTATQVMERALVHFPGAVIVVSHDRFFIDKVATRLLVFEGQGRASTVNANWTQWQASRGSCAR